MGDLPESVERELRLSREAAARASQIPGAVCPDFVADVGAAMERRDRESHGARLDAHRHAIYALIEMERAKAKSAVRLETCPNCRRAVCAPGCNHYSAT